MIERVARALAKQEGYAYDPEPYDARARAAIEAMREPTMLMLDRACHIAAGDTAVQASANTKEAWELMIDAALSEPEESK